jgi:hypothetical protein
MKKYDEAILLLHLTKSIPETERLARLCQVQTLLAFHLFNMGNYESAMELFRTLDISPILVVALYPTLLTSEIQMQLEYPIEIHPPSASHLNEGSRLLTKAS